MAWEAWDPTRETYQEYLDRNFNNPQPFQAGAPEAVAGPPEAAAVSSPPPAATAPAVTTAPLGTTPEQQSARGILDATLARAGLPASLGDRLWNEEYLGKGTPAQTIVDVILPQTPEFKTAYPAYDTLFQKGRPITVKEYQGLVGSYTGLMQRYGLPESFWDETTDFTAWIGGEVSPAEVEARVKIASAASLTAPPEVRDALSQYYGIKPGDLTAYWLNPEKALPIIQQQFATAEVGGAATRTGFNAAFGTLTREEAERLSGIGAGTAEQFGGMAQLAPLFAETAEETVDIGRAEALGAIGQEAGAQETIRRRKAAREARFAGGGGAAGIGGRESGLGSAR
jgi:hypothetical protein